MERQIAPQITEVEAVRPTAGSRAMRKVQVLVAVFVVLAVSTFGLGTANAAQAARPSTEAAESEFFSLLNSERARAGKAALEYDANLTLDARGWSAVMVPTNSIFHTTSLAADTARSVPGWQRAGENVGRGWDVVGLHRAFVNSPGHYANIVGDYTHVGIGVVYTSDRTYVTFRFAKAPVAKAAIGGLAAPKPDAGLIQAQVRRLYLAFFLREADASGQAYWVSIYNNGGSLSSIANGFVGSQEFQSRYGSLDNASFVAMVYRNVMQREADSAGLGYWINQMNQGMSRGSLMVNFSESAEFIARNS